jgi:hypothetical protein
MALNNSSQEKQLPAVQKPDCVAEPVGQDLDYENLACSPWIGLHFRTIDGLND